MRKIDFSIREIWFGYHKELGGFLYDKGSQLSLSDKKVRLFKLDEGKTTTFMKDILKKNAIKFDEDIFKKYKDKIDKYTSILFERVKNKRQTHCYDCKLEIDSIDFLICDECKWIKCTCGACGCGWHGDHI